MDSYSNLINILNEHINSNYENLDHNLSDLSEKVFEKSCHPNIIVPKYDLKKDDGINQSGRPYSTIELLIESDDLDFSTAGSFISSTIRKEKFDFVGVEKVNFLHDYVFSIISKTTDVKLSEWCKLNNDDDKLTPDIKIETDSSTIFVEFTTNKSSDKNSMIRDIKIKKEKYTQPILDRILFIEKREKEKMSLDSNYEKKLKKVFLFVISVGVDRILTNFSWQDGSDNLVNELCSRMRLGVDVELNLISLGLIKSSAKEEVDDGMQKIKRMFQLIKYKPEESFDFTSECLKKNKISNFVLEKNSEKENQDLSMQLCVNTINELRARSPYLNAQYNNELTKEDEDLAEKLITSDRLLNKSRVECQQKIKKYETDNSSIDLRKDLKSIIKIPLLVLNNDNSSSNYIKDDFSEKIRVLPTFNDRSNSVAKIWSTVLDSINYGDVMVDDESLEEQFERASNPIEKNNKTIKRSYHRVKTPLTLEDRIDLAKVGLWGKSFLKNDEVIFYKEEKKIPFSINVFTDDIKNFVQEEIIDWFDFVDNQLHYTTDKVLEIIKDSVSLHHSNFESGGFFEIATTLLRTPLMRYCKLVSDIASEIAVSINQHTTDEEFIIKKLKDHSMFLLIRPTNASGPIFFSLMWNMKDEDKISESTINPFVYHEVNGWRYTDFRSVNNDKLHNLIGCESMMFNMSMFWMNEYKINIFDNNFKDLLMKPNFEMKEAMRMIGHSLLCYLEDKKQTENIITDVRYVIMEGMVSFPLIPRPDKMIEKFPSPLKSRLSVFYLKKVIDLIEYIMDGHHFKPSISIIEGKSVDVTRSNLINHFTGTATKDIGLVINLMYVGYLNNKNELMSGNKVNSLYKKIIEMEKKFTLDIQETIGLFHKKTLSELKVHEFSMNMLRLACENSLNNIKRSRGLNVKDQIENDILRKLSLTKISETFGTLKSSSTFDSENDFSFLNENLNDYIDRKKKKELIKKNMIPTRSKVMMESVNYIKLNYEIWDLIQFCHDELMEKNRIDVDLFDKAQHASIREIFILNFPTRVCQYTIESIARCICNYFPIEMMTHPKSKDTMMTNHAVITGEKFENTTFVQVSTSDDAAKWNQAHFAPKLALVLCYFSPKYMWPFISNVIELWSKRNIKIDPRLIEIMERNENLIVNDQEFQELYNMYKGYDRNPCSWYKGDKKRYISIKSGFMQGILHYSSSLLHVLSLELTSSFMKTHLDKPIKKLGISYDKIISTSMVSSDDSSMILSLPVKNHTDLKQVLTLTSYTFLLKDKVGLALGIIPSVKCTKNTLFATEFNSIFSFSDSRFHAYIKQAIACTVISEKESFISRQEELSNAITSLVENGSSFMLASLCQIGQALLFYRMMGTSLLPITTRKIIPLLKELKDPSVGYFLMDNPLMAGVSGFKYNLWNLLCENPEMNMLMKYLLGNALIKDATDDIRSKKFTLHTTTTGILTAALIIPYGKNRKLEKAQKVMEADEEVFYYINENSELLYRKPKTFEELITMYKLKILSPGVSESFSRGEGLTKKMAHSVYLVINAVVEETPNFYSTKTHTGREKTSITKRILESLNMIKYEIKNNYDVDSMSLTDDEFKILFPNYTDYQLLKNSVDSLKHTNLVKNLKHFKTVKTNITVIENNQNLLPVNQLVAWKWFGRNACYSNRILNDLWNRLKIPLVWLKDNPNETLQESPFNNHYQLFNFFSRTESTGRTIRMLGSPLGHASSQANIITMVCRNILKGYELPLSMDDKKKTISADYKSLQHAIMMINALPLKHEQKRIQIEKCLLNTKLLPEVPIAYNNRKACLHYIQRFLISKTKNINDQEIFQSIFESKYGILGGFVTKQKSKIVDDKVVYFGPGVWSGKIGDVNTSIHINSTPDYIPYIEKIFVNKRFLSRDFYLDLKNFSASIGITNNVIPKMNILDSVNEVICKIRNFMNSGSGAPIYKNVYLITSFDSYVFSDLEFTVFRDTLNLKIKKSESYYDENMKKHRMRTSNISVLSYTSKRQDFNSTLDIPYIDSFNLRPFLVCWIGNKAMNKDDLITLILKAKNKDDLDKFDMDSFHEWCKDGFLSSCAKLGIIKHKKLIDIKKDNISTLAETSDLVDMTTEDLANEVMDLFDFDEMDEFENDFQGGSWADIVENEKEFITDIFDFEGEYDEEAIQDYFDFFKKEREISEPIQLDKSLRFNSNFFNLLAEYLIIVCGKKELNSLISEKKISDSVARENIDLLCYLLRIDKKDITIEKTEIYRSPAKIVNIENDLI